MKYCLLYKRAIRSYPTGDQCPPGLVWECHSAPIGEYPFYRLCLRSNVFYSKLYSMGVWSALRRMIPHTIGSIPFCFSKFVRNHSPSDVTCAPPKLAIRCYLGTHFVRSLDLNRTLCYFLFLELEIGLFSILPMDRDAAPGWSSAVTALDVCFNGISDTYSYFYCLLVIVDQWFVCRCDCLCTGLCLRMCLHTVAPVSLCRHFCMYDCIGTHEFVNVYNS